MTTNPWIQHVKKYASKKGISYTQALKDPKVKKGYKPMTAKKGGALTTEQETANFLRDANRLKEEITMLNKENAFPPFFNNFVNEINELIENEELTIKQKYKKLKKIYRDQGHIKLITRGAYIQDDIDEFVNDGHLNQEDADNYTNEIDEALEENMGPRFNSQKHDKLTEIEKKIRKRVAQNQGQNPEPDPF